MAGAAYFINGMVVKWLHAGPVHRDILGQGRPDSQSRLRSQQGSRKSLIDHSNSMNKNNVQVGDDMGASNPNPESRTPNILSSVSFEAERSKWTNIKTDI